MACRRLLTLSLFLPLAAHAFIWPFGRKRFKSNGFIGAGPLGLQDVDGRVVAFGDFDGDQFMDVVTLSEDQRTMTLHYWDHDDFIFRDGPSIKLPRPVHNVVPGDFTHDGMLDVLVVYESASHNQLDMAVYVGSKSGFLPNPLQVPSSTLEQIIPIDANGDMKIDLLGYPSSSGENKALKIWNNTWDASKPSSSAMFTLIDPQFVKGQVCNIANPHSNAMLDFDGDCLADLFLLCKDPRSSRKSFQIWLNDKTGSFIYALGGELPEGAGAISFADMDRDGTMDMVFPTCSSVSTSTGIGTDCAINIAYNVQKPLCAPSTMTNRNCRLPEDLCTSDPQFTFNLSNDPSNKAFTRIPLGPLLPTLSNPGLLMLDTTYSPPISIPLKIGDSDLDGFPDLLLIAASNPHGGILGLGEEYDRTPYVLRSVRCEDGSKCVAGTRTFEQITKHTEPLADIKDARSATFLDMDEDGTLDILVQRTGKQTGAASPKIVFIQNNFFHDAFFLKAIVLNGACNGWCTPPNSSEPRYHPFGVSYSGASYKYTILDTTGRRSAAQVAQLPQTAYHALLTPYSFFGLGRTNNYIENLFVGSTKHSKDHYINMEGVIPNSKVVIMPSSPKAEGDDGPWKRELYLRPGEWIPWVTLTVVVATAILAIIVFVLHLNEKREDELERRRALHHINFDAL